MTSAGGAKAERYVVDKTAAAKKAIQEFACGDAKKVTAQDPIEDVTPDVPEVVEDLTPEVVDTPDGVNGVGDSSSSYVDTPYGKAYQTYSDEALSVKQYVEDGGTVYRGGTIGRSKTLDAQFWATESPLTSGYADKYGVDFSSLDYIVAGKVKSGTDFITRPAPGLGDNAGGAIEVVTPPNSIELESFYMLGDRK